MHYYKRNIGDYYKRASRLNWNQHAALMLIKDACYDRESFPTFDEAVEWTWAQSDDEVNALKFVLSRFFVLSEDGRYTNDEILNDLLDYHKRADINKRIATEREEKRKKSNETFTNRARTVNESSPKEHETPPNQEPITNNQEPITNNQEPVIFNEQESESEAKQKPSKTRAPKPIDLLLDAGVDEQTAKDFLQVRSVKKLPLTATALKGIADEAEKAGLTTVRAVEIATKNGWAGFKASWDWQEKSNGNRPAKSKHDLSGIDYTAGINADGSF